MLIPPSPIQSVSGIDDLAAERIKVFMQGAVYCWVKNNPQTPFAVRDLMGGENFEWEGTPLFVLYMKQINLGVDEDDAIRMAAIDLGWLTKAMLVEDKRSFKAAKVSGKFGPVSSYTWVGNEP